MDKIQVFKISNKNKIELTVSNFGVTITSLKVPDRNKKLIDVIIGLENISDYTDIPYANHLIFLGSSIGRYAGRISKGGFEIDGKRYELKNKNGVHLHSENGFDKQIWNVSKTAKSSLEFEYTSNHLENGYPGNLKVKVIFELNDENELKITYNATTDQATPVNLTIHPYFNLNGKNSILNHELQINSQQHLEVDNQLIPTGKIINSKDTVFDFKKQTKIGKSHFLGFDDTFILQNTNLKASLYAEESGINLDIFTNQPSFVIYTPKQFPDLPFKEKTNNCLFPAICFEPQNFPDAPNNPNFPNSILQPNEIYVNESIFKFSVL